MFPFPFQSAGFGLVGGASTTLWTPANLGTFPFLWYDPNTAVTDAGSGACSKWDNANANGYYLEASGSNRPLIVPAGINGHRLIRFDGTADYMRTAGPSPRAIFQNATSGYIFIVFKRAVSTGGGVARLLMFNGTNSGSNARLTMYCDNTSAAADKVSIFVRRLDGDSAAQLVGATSVNSGWHMALALMDWSTGDGFIYVDGQLDASNTSLTTSGSTSNTAAANNSCLASTVSGAQPADIDCPEVFAGAYLPTTDEIDKIFGYAAHRYGLTSLLDVSHPYKTTAPTV